MSKVSRCTHPYFQLSLAHYSMRSLSVVSCDLPIFQIIALRDAQTATVCFFFSPNFCVPKYRSALHSLRRLRPGFPLFPYRGPSVTHPSAQESSCVWTGRTPESTCQQVCQYVTWRQLIAGKASVSAAKKTPRPPLLCRCSIPTVNSEYLMLLYPGLNLKSKSAGHQNVGGIGHGAVTASLWRRIPRCIKYSNRAQKTLRMCASKIKYLDLEHRLHQVEQLIVRLSGMI